MKIMIVTDAWEPQVNGVVCTLGNTRRELQALGHTVEMLTPQEFITVPCPTYPEIRLSLLPGARVRRRIEAFAPEALHIATEGPLGLAARGHAVRHRLPFTTAYHTRFPEYVYDRLRIPLGSTYRFLRWFHKHSRAVLVPTAEVERDLRANGFERVVRWGRGVDTELFKPFPRETVVDRPPVFLYAGRLSVEKNIDAFLALDLPGVKWVVGDGPARARLQSRYPDAKFFGMRRQNELARIYSDADVFVFPSTTDTFGLVLIEALACGLPVAAYPVTGPVDVVGDSAGAALDTDLKTACLRAMSLSRDAAREHALKFTWAAATQQFVSHLQPMRSGAA